jgi:osmoprotectant transport system substrate-binding protein
MPDKEGTLSARLRLISTALAALLAASAVAATASGSARPEKAAQQPTIILGTKNFTEQFILGELYKQGLQAKGYRVTLKSNIGSTELIDKSLTSGQINMYPEYTGTMLTVVFGRKNPPKSANAVYNLAKQLQQRRGFTLFAKTPFFDVDALAVLKSTATRHKLKTIGDLKRLGSQATLGALPEFRTRLQGLIGLRRLYGLTQVKFVPFAGISPYAALDQRKVLIAAIFSTDPQLASGKYVVLTDPRANFGFQNVAPVVSQELAGELGAGFRRSTDAITRKLTTKAMIAMNKAVAIDKRSPRAVADAFLKANKLK